MLRNTCLWSFVCVHYTRLQNGISNCSLGGLIPTDGREIRKHLHFAPIAILLSTDELVIRTKRKIEDTFFKPVKIKKKENLVFFEIIDKYFSTWNHYNIIMIIIII